MSDKDKVQKMMENYQSTMDKAGVLVLNSIVGEWAVGCLKSNTPMNASTFKEWAETAKLSKGQKHVIDGLLKKITQ